jgi:glutamine amidotransferase
MSLKTVHIIDYGSSNLLSISRAFEHIGAQVIMVKNAEDIQNAHHLILPGVGAFPDGMQAIKKSGFDQAIQHYAQTGKPLMGICLGMQLLLDIGTEIQEIKGLGLIPGKVIELPRNQPGFKVPNINWHQVNALQGHPLFESIHASEMFYFVHSYYAQTEQTHNTIALTDFGNIKFASVIAKDNVMGTQFHPEKSGKKGLQMLQNFLNIK